MNGDAGREQGNVPMSHYFLELIYFSEVNNVTLFFLARISSPIYPHSATDILAEVQGLERNREKKMSQFTQSLVVIQSHEATCFSWSSV